MGLSQRGGDVVTVLSSGLGRAPDRISVRLIDVDDLDRDSARGEGFGHKPGCFLAYRVAAPCQRDLDRPVLAGHQALYFIERLFGAAFAQQPVYVLGDPTADRRVAGRKTAHVSVAHAERAGER